MVQVEVDYVRHPAGHAPHLHEERSVVVSFVFDPGLTVAARRLGDLGGRHFGRRVEERYRRLGVPLRRHVRRQLGRAAGRPVRDVEREHRRIPRAARRGRALRHSRAAAVSRSATRRANADQSCRDKSLSKTGSSGSSGGNTSASPGGSSNGSGDGNVDANDGDGGAASLVVAKSWVVVLVLCAVGSLVYL